MDFICVDAEYGNRELQNREYERCNLAYDLCRQDYENREEEIDEETNFPNFVGRLEHVTRDPNDAADDTIDETDITNYKNEEHQYSIYQYLYSEIHKIKGRIQILLFPILYCLQKTGIRGFWISLNKL